MKKRIIISESEKKTILGLYNLLKENVTDDIKVGDTFLREYQALNEKILILINEIGTDVNFNRTNLVYKTGQKLVNEQNYNIELFKESHKNYNKIDKTEYDKIISDFDANQKSKNNDETKKGSDESVTISGVVKKNTIDGKKGLSGTTLTFEDTDDKENVKIVKTDNNGNFKVILPYVGKYKVTVEKKGFQSYSKTFNFNDDINFNIPLSPKKGIIPKIKMGVQNIIDKLKDYYDTRDPKENEVKSFTKSYSVFVERAWKDSESQQEYCRNFTENYFEIINRLNKRDADYVNDQSTDYETLLPIAKNFIIDCKKQYGNKLFASSIETKRKFDKIFSTLQNLPPKLKRYEI